MADKSAGDRELTITRVFDVTREKVFKAWTDQKLIRRWWGPRGVTNPICEWDARPKGKINIVMLAGKELGTFAGQKWPMVGTFREVKSQSRLAYTSQAMDEVKKVMLETETTVDLEDLGGRAKMRVRIVVTKADDPRSEFMLQGMEQGWNQQIDKLCELLAKM